MLLSFFLSCHHIIVSLTMTFFAQCNSIGDFITQFWKLCPSLYMMSGYIQMIATTILTRIIISFEYGIAPKLIFISAGLVLIGFGCSALPVGMILPSHTGSWFSQFIFSFFAVLYSYTMGTSLFVCRRWNIFHKTPFGDRLKIQRRD